MRPKKRTTAAIPNTLGQACGLALIGMLMTACASGGNVDQERPVADRDSSSDVCESPDDEAPPCDRFLLRTTKSLTDLPSSYVFNMGTTRCDGEDSFTTEGTRGTVQFEYRLLLDPPDVPGYVDFSTTQWDQTGQFFQDIEGSWRVQIDSLDHLGPNVESAAVQFRARPVNAQREPVGVEWSDWVQVNHGTRYGLLRVSDYWHLQPREPLSFHGTNFAQCEDFDAQMGWRSPDAFERGGMPVPTTQASAVMYFTKANRFGYHTPSFEWGGADHPLWAQGLGFNLFWVDTPKPYPADGNGYERWIMSNATEWHCDPDFDDYLDPDGEAFASANCRYFADGSVPEFPDTLFNQPATNDPDLRNYILAPEYVGQGWGIAALHGQGDRKQLWGVHANVWSSNELPQVDGAQREVLQLKYYEGPANYLTHGDTPWGHREDWYLDRQGPMRVEGRNVGPRAGIGESRAQLRLPGTADPDLMHREVIAAPQYCMTRNGAGTCTLDRWGEK